MTQLQSGESYFDCDFKKLDEKESRFEDIEFEQCRFEECDFSEAVFRRCKFIECDFSRCNLSLVTLADCRLFTVAFDACKLIGIDWTKANWPVYHVDFELSFRQCLLNDSSFFGLTLNALKMEECKLREVDFREGEFSNSSLTYCDFEGSLFMRTNLQEADFTESTGYAINVLENSVKGAKFSRFEAVSLLEGLGIEIVD